MSSRSSLFDFCGLVLFFAQCAFKQCLLSKAFTMIRVDTAKQSNLETGDKLIKPTIDPRSLNFVLISLSYQV